MRGFTRSWFRIDSEDHPFFTPDSALRQIEMYICEINIPTELEPTTLKGGHDLENSHIWKNQVYQKENNFSRTLLNLLKMKIKFWFYILSLSNF